MNKNEYTIGEIFRLGLLKNHRGQPYKSKAAVSTALAVAGIKGTKRPGAYGMTRMIAKSDIAFFNKRYA